MKTASRVLLPIVLALGAGAALAQGPLQGNEVFATDAPSSVTRAQVRAEAAEALRLGLLPQGEIERVATPAQMEQVRQAGLRAAQGATLVQSGAATSAR